LPYFSAIVNKNAASYTAIAALFAAHTRMAIPEAHTKIRRTVLRLSSIQLPVV
jgi:hypothetical protein